MVVKICSTVDTDGNSEFNLDTIGNLFVLFSANTDIVICERVRVNLRQVLSFRLESELDERNFTCYIFES